MAISFGQIKKGIPQQESPSLSQPVGNYLAASSQQDFAASPFSQQEAAESHFSVQASQAALVAAASVAVVSAVAAFLLAFPQQLTIATAQSTMAKEKIFFMALNI